MQERQYQERVEKYVDARLAKLQAKEQVDVGTFSAFPNQAYRFEEMLNQARFRLNSKGFIFVPIREPHQVQYKLGRNYPQLNSFEQQEQEAQTTQYLLQRLTKKRVKKQLLYCFLVLTELQKHAASFLLTQVPDPIFFKLGDYSEIIEKPIDLITICGKLLRDVYESPDEFQNDMVRLIQNNKIYFLFHEEIYSLLLRFEQEFWFLIEQMVPKYKAALASRLRSTRLLGAQKRKASLIKKYNKLQRKQLVALVAQQNNKRKKIIFDYIKQNCPQYIKLINYNETIQLQKMPPKFLREIEGLCEIRIEFQRESEPQQVNYTAKQVVQILRGEGEIYFGSDDDDD